MGARTARVGGWPCRRRTTDSRISRACDDSSLTGESQPKRRSAEPCAARATIDVPNVVFAGTTVVAGRGRAVVYATGMRTEAEELRKVFVRRRSKG